MEDASILRLIKSPTLRWTIISLAILSPIASICAVVFTAVISINANRLQQGDNTINVIDAYGGQAVREGRSALYEISEREIIDPSNYARSFARVAPVRGALGFVATCYRDGLCLDTTILDYFCVDVLQYDAAFGSGAPAFRSVMPESADLAFNELVQDCRDVEEN